MKKILLSAGFAAALLMSVNANAWHGHGGYYRGGWVGPAIVGGVVALLLWIALLLPASPGY